MPAQGAKSCYRAVVFLGPPGAGKGTQTRALAERLGVPYLSTGDMLRDHISRGTALGRQADAVVAAGELVPDELVNSMVGVWFKQQSDSNGVVLDGFPRTVNQARELDQWLGNNGPVVINFRVEYNELIQRLTGRRSCPQCRRIYNVYLKPPARDGFCDCDGARLTQRPDDDEQVIRERLAAYERQTRPLVEFYRQRTKFFEVDGNQPPETVTNQLCRILEGADVVCNQQ